MPADTSTSCLRRNGAATPFCHLTDCHAQLLPVHFREPDTNISAGSGNEKLAHLSGEALLQNYGFRKGSREAYAYTHLDFPNWPGDTAAWAALPTWPRW